MDTKECPRCKVEMQPGRFLNNGLVWTGKQQDDVYEKCVRGCEALPAYGVRVYRCPQCNLLEAYTDEREMA